MNRSESITEIAKALAEIQKSPIAVKKDGVNPFFDNAKYATLHAIMEKVKPVLTEHGLLLIQSPSFSAGELNVTSTLIHVESGEWVSCDPGSQATDAQKVGSAITYHRRYGISSLLCLVTEEDDDGSAAAKTKDKPKDAPKSTGKDKGKPEADQKLELIVKITNICMEVAEGDEDQAGGVLLDVSTYEFEQDAGGMKTVVGTRKSNDLKKYTLARLQATYGRAKDAKKGWEAAHGEPVPEADPDIPF